MERPEYYGGPDSSGIVTVPGIVIPLDLSQLSGFSFECRPGCGLCCYAEPLVAPTEKAALIQLVPGVRFSSRGRDEFLQSHPGGGACQLLQGTRCSAHGARPTPCREFPLTAHVGERVQATVVLSCPGVDLSSLARYGGPDPASPPRGFDEEVSALRTRMDGTVRARVDASVRRRRRIRRALVVQRRWEEEDEVRRQLLRRMPTAQREDFPVPGPPTGEDGLERLPLTFGGRAGPVAFEGGLGGWELLELRPTGGVERSVGVAQPPDRPPRLSEEAALALAGYLRYWLGRDLLFGIVHLAMLEGTGGSVSDLVGAELREIAALTLSRAYVLAGVRRGDVGELSAEDLREGIRATDQDLLDRPSWGTRL